VWSGERERRCGTGDRGMLEGCGPPDGTSGDCGGMVGIGGRKGWSRMSILELVESVHHLLFEVASNLLDHLVGVEWRWIGILHFRWNLRLWRFGWWRSLCSR
jgi:hypothetical protein